MDQFNSTPQQEDSIDIKDLLFKILGFWPFIVGSMIIGLSIAFIINRYSRNVYELSTVLNVEEAENPLGGSGVSLAFNWGGMDALESKVAVLKSYSLQEAVAKKLKWEVSYYSIGRIKVTEEYYSAPFKVVFDQSHLQPIGIPFEVTLVDGGFEIFTNSEEWDKVLYSYLDAISYPANSDNLPQGKFNFNEWISGDNFRFQLVETSALTTSTKFLFQFNSYASIAKSNMKNIDVSTGNERGSTLLYLSSKGNNALKTADFLNTVSMELRGYELLRKNIQANNTISFIDSQLNNILATLRNSEGSLEAFRSDNLIIDIGAEGK